MHPIDVGHHHSRISPAERRSAEFDPCDSDSGYSQGVTGNERSDFVPSAASRSYSLIKAKRSALIVAACVVGIPCG